MKLELALTVAKQMCDKTHPSTIVGNIICPDLRMILVNNGQYITSTNLERAKKVWTFEEFVKEFQA